MEASMNNARTYNQYHTPRKYQGGRRRVTIYNSWSYPAEANRNLSELDNRFSTMTELKRVEWPHWEGEKWSDRNFMQGIAGTLELFYRAWIPFQQVAYEASGNAVPV